MKLDDHNLSRVAGKRIVDLTLTVSERRVPDDMLVAD